MTKELSLPCRYKVTLDTSSQTYSFSTDKGAEYEIYFSDSSALFSSTLPDQEINQIVINKTKSGDGIADPEIKNVVSAIIEYYFKNKDRVLLYFCSAEGDHEFARDRLFSIWFNTSDLSQVLIKEDIEFTLDEITQKQSFIYHVDNSFGVDNISSSIASFEYELNTDKG